MVKKLNMTRIAALMLAVLMIGTACITPALAVEPPTYDTESALIDMDADCSLTVYKYDFTNAAKDGVWSAESYVSTGQYDANVNTILGEATRKGSNSSTSNLGNGGTSEGYAIAGVEFSYLKVADHYQYTESKNNDTSDAHIELLYKFDKTLSADLLKAIGLSNGKDSHEKANALDNNAYFYQSDVLIAALGAALENNATAVKDALESYIVANNGTAMDMTDENGYTRETGMDVGLYILAETKTSESVTVTCNPFFVSLPMTNINGGGDGSIGNDTMITDGGHKWLYDVTIYPKNETGIPTLLKEVREDKAYTGVNNDTAAINDGFDHYATASAGDRLDYQIVSTMPTITSDATALTVLEYKDLLCAGIEYDAATPVVIEWFTDEGCTDKVTTWNVADGMFTVDKKANNDGTTTMTVALTEAGLAVLNGHADGQTARGLYKGYSNYTLRISYSAFLNSDDSLVYGDSGNDNKVVMTWKRTSSEYLDTLIDDCHVFVYGINLTKRFSNGVDDQATFDHVHFVLKNASDDYFVKASLGTDNIYYVNGIVEDPAEATIFHPVEANGKKGQVIIKGLENDEYVMTETETADGFVLLKDDIHIKISATVNRNDLCDIYGEDTLGVIQNDPRFAFDGGLDLSLANIPQNEMAHYYLMASATVDDNSVTMLEDNGSKNALAPLTIVNTKGFELPQTGETGTRMMPIIGATLVVIAVGACAMFLLPKRKEENQA